VLFYQQDVESPYMISQVRTDVEFAGIVPEALWRSRQGAWFARSFREDDPQEVYYYWSLPKVQLFVPLSEDGASFDYAKAEHFRVARYASALVHAGRLKVSGARLDWMMYPTADYKRRWFILTPSETTADSASAALEMDISDALGSRTLSLSFRVEPLPGIAPGIGPLDIVVEGLDSVGRVQTLIKRSSTARGIANVPADDIVLDIPPDVVRVRLAFDGLNAKEMIRVLELQLVSNDVAPGLADSFCAR
jgi:hypothetical protein